MSEKVALIGAGVMGNAIGTRLLGTDHELIVFDLDSEKVQALVDLGARAAVSAADAATEASVVILSLNNAAIVDRAVFGEVGVAETAAPETLIIDMSSIAPDATRELAERALAKSLHWVDSPLSGGAPKALIGSLTLMLGGSDEAAARAKSFLSALSDNCTHMGPPGAGQTTKLINQVLCGLGSQTVRCYRNTCRGMPAGITHRPAVSITWSRTSMPCSPLPDPQVPPCH